MKRSWTDEQLIEAVKNNTCMSDILRTLGFLPIGSQYRAIRGHIQRLNLDISHLKPYKSSNVKKMSSEELFSSKTANNKSLKRRLIKDGLRKYECESCKINEYSFYGQAIKLTLQLDHIDGDPTNNVEKNLRLLCPNCHSLTPTFCGKNTKKELKYNSCVSCCMTIEEGNRCVLCKQKYVNEFKSIKNWPKIEVLVEKLKEYKSLSKVAFIFQVSPNGLKGYLQRIGKLEETLNLLKSFQFKKRPKKKELPIGKIRNRQVYRANWPSKEELEKMVWEKSAAEIGKELGVTGSAVGKMCKKMNIEKPVTGYYWQTKSMESKNKKI